MEPHTPTQEEVVKALRYLADNLYEKSLYSMSADVVRAIGLIKRAYAEVE